MWCIRTLPNLSEYCRVHTGTSEARPVWHPTLPRLLFTTSESVLLFVIGEERREKGESAENQPDGVIKESRPLRIARAGFLDSEHVVVVLENELGVRVWRVGKRHEPVLSVGCRHFFSSAKFIGFTLDKFVYILDVSFTVTDKWRLPEGVIFSRFIFLDNKRHYSGKYGVLGWQGEEQVLCVVSV
jgi:hypothetical protein